MWTAAIGSIRRSGWVSIQGGKRAIYRITWNTGDIDKRRDQFSKSGIIKVQNSPDAGGLYIFETERK